MDMPDNLYDLDDTVPDEGRGVANNRVTRGSLVNKTSMFEFTELQSTRNSLVKYKRGLLMGQQNPIRPSRNTVRNKTKNNNKLLPETDTKEKYTSLFSF